MCTGADSVWTYTCTMVLWEHVDVHLHAPANMHSHVHTYEVCVCVICGRTPRVCVWGTSLSQPQPASASSPSPISMTYKLSLYTAGFLLISTGQLSLSSFGTRRNRNSPIKLPDTTSEADPKPCPHPSVHLLAFSQPLPRGCVAGEPCGTCSPYLSHLCLP